MVDKHINIHTHIHILIHIIASVLAIELLLHIDLGRPPPQDSGSEYHEHDKAARSSQDPW